MELVFFCPKYIPPFAYLTVPEFRGHLNVAMYSVCVGVCMCVCVCACVCVCVRVCM